MNPDTAFNPNAWTTGELISLGMATVLFMCCLAFSLWKALRTDRSRLYWIACAVLIIAGTLGMVFAPTSAPNTGEMPPEFGLATWVMLLGLLATFLGAVWGMLHRLFGKT